MKPAEFTDYASARAFLAAGRKKGQRATNDGWNTVLYDRGSMLDLQLHGTSVVQYTMAGTIVTIPMRNSVVLDRIQRYALADQYRIVTDARKQWRLEQAWQTLPGIVVPQTLYVPALFDVPPVLELDSARNLVVPTPLTKPGALSASDRRLLFDVPTRRWAASATKALEEGIVFDSATWHACYMCVDNLGNMSRDSRHLMSHLLEGVVLPSTIMSFMAGVKHLINFVIDPAGNGDLKIANTVTAPTVRTMLRNSMRNQVR